MSRFTTPQIAAVGGWVDIRNKHDNWLTRMQVVKYWYAYFVMKNIEQAFQRVMVLSGCLTAYRRTVLLELMPILEKRALLVVKEGAARTFTILDAAMNDLLRPSLYDAWHGIEPVRPGTEKMVADVVGPVCETGDYLALSRSMQGVAEGEYLAVMSAGAYGAVMASTYNSRPLVPEVLVEGKNWHVIRPRPEISELIGKGKTQITMDKVAIELAAPSAAADAAITCNQMAAHDQYRARQIALPRTRGNRRSGNQQPCAGNSDS